MHIKHVINFSGHPLSKTVVDKLVEDGYEVETLSVGVDLNNSLSDQVRKLVDNVKSIPLDGTVPFIITLPGLSELTAFLLAELNGRCGGFPFILQIRRAETGTFEISTSLFGENNIPGVVDLERVRLKARSRRWKRTNKQPIITIAKET